MKQIAFDVLGALIGTLLAFVILLALTRPAAASTKDNIKVKVKVANEDNRDEMIFLLGTIDNPDGTATFQFSVCGSYVALTGTVEDLNNEAGGVAIFQQLIDKLCK